MQRATVLLSEIEASNLNQEEDSNQLVVWSVTVPKKKSIISQSALGEKQVCLTLDTVGNNIQIAEWPSAGEASALVADLALAKDRRDSTSDEKEHPQHRTATSSRMSMATKDWETIFGGKNKKQHSRWPMKFIFEDVGMFIRGSDGRSLIFNLLYQKEVTVTFLTKEEREVFCLLLFLVSRDIKVSDEGEVWSQKPFSVSYPVQLVKRIGSTEKINLMITFSDERMHVVWMRKRDAHAHSSGRPLPIREDWRLERDTWNRTRLTIRIPSLEQPLRVKFPSIALRERFCGHIRVIMRQINVQKIEQQGWSADPPKAEDLTVFCCTYNAADTESRGKNAVHHLLGEKQSDIIMIVLEECKKKEQWIADLETCLNTSERFRGHEYKMVGTMTLWAIHVIVYAKGAVHSKISHVRTAEQATGIGHVMGNKGGVAVAFTYDDDTHFCFVGSHLAARAKRLKERAQNYRDIVEKMKGILLEKGSEFIHQFDYVFWGGDLNYRINLKDGPGYDTEGEFKTVLKMISEKEYDKLYENDQLKDEINAGRVFTGFKEGKINFAPTYRMVRNHHDYSNKRFQSPSWTDRILWRTAAGLEDNVEVMEYLAMFKMRQSDHRPVGARFKVKTNVPFLNVVRKGNFYGSENCDVHFGSVSFNFNEELATTDQSVLDAADDEDDGGNSNNNSNNNNNDVDKSKFQRKSSTPADKKKKISAYKKVTRYLFKGKKSKKDKSYKNRKEKHHHHKGHRKSIVQQMEETVLGDSYTESLAKDLYITLYADFLESPITSEVISVNADPETGEVRGTWEEGQVPTVFPAVGDASYIRTQHILIVVRMKDEGAHTTWHKIGHSELFLGANGVSIRRDLAQDMPMTTRRRTKSVEGLNMVRLPLVLHGVVVGAINFQVQIRKINSLDGQNDKLKEEIMRQKDMARRQSFLSMKTSGKHNNKDFAHATGNAPRSSDMETMNPKDSYLNLLAKDFEILEHTDEEVHESHVIAKTVEHEEVKAKHIHDDHKANRRVSIAGALHTDKINDGSDDNNKSNSLPPPPSFSESEHRMSAMLFHVPPPPGTDDDITNLPPPPAPPGLTQSIDVNNLPPPPPPPGLS